MTNIKLISDLCDSEVLYAITDGGSNNKILDIEDSENILVTLQLMNELTKGRKSGEEEGWFTLKEVEKNLGITK